MIEREDGFTLTEVMVASAIFAVVLALCAHFIIFVYGEWISTNADLDPHVLVQRWVTETRDARAILTLRSDRMVLWTADEDGNGAPSPDETRLYEFDDNRWLRDGTPLLSEITDGRFNADGTPPDARHVIIHLTHRGQTIHTGTNRE